MFCKSKVIVGESNFFFRKHPSISFVPRSLVSADSSRKFYLSFLPLGSLFSEIQEYFLEHWISTLRKLSLLWKRTCSSKNNRKGLQKCLQKTTKRTATTPLQSWKKYMRQTLVSMWNSAMLISIFQHFSASIKKIEFREKTGH